MLLLGLLATCGLQKDPVQPKLTAFTSIYGNRVTYRGMQAYWSTGHPTALLLGLPVAETASLDDINAQADRFFQEYAGAEAEDMGFHRVVIQPDNGKPAGIGAFGYRISLHVDVGTGPANFDAAQGLIAYDRADNGIWRRDGAGPPAPDHIREITLKTGAKFAWTWGFETSQSGYFAYDCLSCQGKAAARLAALNLYDVLRDATGQASGDGLKKLSVAIFLGPRRSLWEFPTVIHVQLARRADGKWIGPLFSASALESYVERYAVAARQRGAQMMAKPL